MVSDRGQCCDKSIAPICHATKGHRICPRSSFFLSDSGGGEKPVEVSLVHTLREEGDHSQEITGVGAKFTEGEARESSRVAARLSERCNPFGGPEHGVYSILL